jgi:hypothetical protein
METVLSTPLETAGQFLIVSKAILYEGNWSRLLEFVKASLVTPENGTRVLDAWPACIRDEISRTLGLLPESMDQEMPPAVVAAVCETLDAGVLAIYGQMLSSCCAYAKSAAIIVPKLLENADE